MSETTDNANDLTSVIKEAMEAYNAQDWNAYQEFFTEDLHFVHHNRGFEIDGRRPFLDTLQMFAKDLIPDRQFSDPTLLQCGNTVVSRQTWHGSAIADVPGIAAKGETFSLDLCTVYVFDGEKVKEYLDFG